MKWNDYSKLSGHHAFLAPSTPSWLRYEDETLIERYNNYHAAQMGTQLHEFARQSIELGIKLRGSTQTLASYVNDAISYRMTPEQVLFYSEYAFGTADAISFKNGVLRIHDLKTGTVVPGKMEQLRVYAALFCLEYRHDPQELQIILRIYQNDEIREEEADPEVISDIMMRIKHLDRVLRDYVEGLQ